MMRWTDKSMSQIQLSAGFRGLPERGGVTSDFLCLVTRGDMDDVIEKGFGQRSRLAAADGRALVYIVN